MRRTTVSRFATASRTAAFAATLTAVALTAVALTAGCGKDLAKPETGPSPMSAAMTPVEMTASKSYALKTCVVSGEALDAMGGPIAYKVGDTEVQLCCATCLTKLAADPAKYTAMVKAAAK